MERVWRSEWAGQIYFSHGSESGHSGVAILVPNGFQHPVREVFTDVSGRIVCVEIEVESHKVPLVGVYAPSVDDQTIKCDFIDQLRQILLGFSYANLVLAGDFNIRLSALDSDSQSFRGSRASTKLKDLLDEFSLEDAWRVQHSKERKYTWRRLNPLQQSRIDLILASSTILNNNIVKTKIEAGVLSDHSFVMLKFILPDEPRGPGLWRFNNLLLDDSEFTQLVRSEISKAKSAHDPYDIEISKGVKVEMLLSNIRVSAIKRSKTIARELRATENDLYASINELESTLAVSRTEEIQRKYDDMKRKLDEIKTDRGKAAMIRSQAIWTEDGEKSSKYFLRMVQQRMAEKTINVLQNEDGSFVHGHTAILQKCVEHFKLLYSSNQVKRECMDLFSPGDNDPRLSEEEKLSCEGSITKEECRTALATMARNKVGGISGFTAEFFAFFWNELGDVIVEYINSAKHDQLFVTHMRGVLTLIPKKGDQKLLINKRPICLLDVIYKLIAKVLVTRMNKVIDKLVNRNQTGFMKGRYIGENTRLISDVITYCETDNIDGILLAVDYRNAFDSIEHEFIWYTLEAFNFGQEVIAWIKLLYTGAQLTIYNNGYTSQWFNCTRGTFQGSPLSGLLFILVGEMLANRLRREDTVQGITISGIEVKINMYADDTTIFLNSEQSMCKALTILDEFTRASGLEMNKNKTKLMWLGPARFRTDGVCGVAAVSKVKILGIYHSASLECAEENIAPIIQRIRNATNSWSQRSLTIKGRITIVKALLISQLVYVASSVKISNVDLKTIHSLIMRFTWRGRPPKVAHATLAQHIKDGGLMAPDVWKCYESLRLQWVRRLYSHRNSQWCQLFQARLGNFRIADFLRTRNAKSFVKDASIPAFYKDLIGRYQAIFSAEVTNARQARAESLWHNVMIQIGGKPVFIKHMYEAGIKIINDLIDEDGNLMNLAKLREKYPQLRINFLRFQSIKNAIPSSWKNMIRSDPRGVLNPEEKKCCLINIHENKTICLKSLRSHHIYNALLDRRIPTAQRKWEEEGFDIKCWEHVYTVPYKCTSSTKLQSLQYRILHRYIPTRKFLCSRNVIGSKLCRKCFEVDNLQHFFYACEDVSEIWKVVLTRLKNKFSFLNDFLSVDTVIFGCVNSPPIVNLVILLCKQYITSCKLSEDYNTSPSLEGAIQVITNQHRVEEVIAKKTNSLDQFEKKWEKVIDRNRKHIFN